MIKLLMLAHSLGFLAYASVLVFCSIANPPREALTRVLRVLTGMVAILLGTNILRDVPCDQHIVFMVAQTLFLFLVTFSAFKALMRK
jgi:hypothetical protein